MTAVATRTELTRLSRPLRLRAGVGWVAVALGAAGLLLGAMAWTVRLGVIATPWWVFAAWAMATAALVGTGAAAWRGLHALSVRRVARRLEDTGLTRQGALTALLDAPAPGTSISLLLQADRVQAAELGRQGATLVEPLAAPLRPLAAAGAVLLLAGAGLRRRLAHERL